MLTERTIRDQKPGPRTHIKWDTKLKGLGCRMTPAGTQAFVLRYTDGTGRQRLATLARVGEVSLKGARALAGREMVKVRMGEVDLLARRRQRRSSLTVEEGIETFFGEFCPKRIRTKRMAPRSVREYRKQARRYLIPVLGKLNINEVKRYHVERMVDPLPPVMRNRVLALTSRIFRYFEDQDLRRQYDNPCRGIERSREEPRDRTLSHAEIAALGRALAESDIHPACRDAIKTGMLTGLRISEVISMRWEFINFECGSILLPATKTGRRTHPLSTATLALLAGIARVGDQVFCTGPNTPITYWKVRSAFITAVKASGLADVRLHDLRRTFMTRAAESGIGAHTLRDLLGHKTATMADRYIRHTNTPVANATEAVSGRLAAMMNSRAPAVALSPANPMLLRPAAG